MASTNDDNNCNKLEAVEQVHDHKTVEQCLQEISSSDGCTSSDFLMPSISSNNSDTKHASCDTACNENVVLTDSPIESNCASASAIASLDEASAAMASAKVTDEEIAAENFAFLPKLQEMIDRDTAAVHCLEEERASFIQKMEQAEAEVHRMVEQLYGLVDNKTNELLAKAAALKAERMDEFARSRSELEAGLNEIRINHSFVQQVMSRASPLEMIQMAPAVNHMNEHFSREEERLSELSRQTIENDDRRIAELNALAELSIDSLIRNAGENLVGNITTSESTEAAVGTDTIAPYLGSAQSLAVILAGSRVQALTFLNDHLYVLRERCSVLEVFDIDTTDQVGQIDVEQLCYPDCIVGSETAHSVFLSDIQVNGVFRISQLPELSVSLIPVEGIPSGLSLSSEGHLVFTFLESKTVHILSIDDNDGVSPVRVLSVSDLCRPIMAMPVPGEDNGVVVCDDTDRGSHWFLCGCRYESTEPQLDQPVELYGLTNVQRLLSDTYGMYVGLNLASGSVDVFDASFCVYQNLLRKSEDFCEVSCIALNSPKGKLAVGHHDGKISLFQVMQTRKKIEINLRQWVS